MKSNCKRNMLVGDRFLPASILHILLSPPSRVPNLALLSDFLLIRIFSHCCCHCRSYTPTPLPPLPPSPPSPPPPPPPLPPRHINAAKHLSRGGSRLREASTHASSLSANHVASSPY
ncbi:hypothetical protein E2C01_058478 [Portunus trituberculatus]|uniref:Uncharacterized protein n=1 Tax=Portunus trituberculatus TaxID=210409 RepID=A0A5B7H686_PORTR|nr:hypothetical protein [Portunus trituberculatus]